MLNTKRFELLKNGIPRGIWVLCIHKESGQPYAGYIIEAVDDDSGKFLYVHIPVLNQEITSHTYNWEILA